MNGARVLAYTAELFEDRKHQRVSMQRKLQHIDAATMELAVMLDNSLLQRLETRVTLSFTGQVSDELTRENIGYELLPGAGTVRRVQQLSSGKWVKPRPADELPRHGNSLLAPAAADFEVYLEGNRLRIANSETAITTLDAVILRQPKPLTYRYYYLNINDNKLTLGYEDQLLDQLSAYADNGLNNAMIRLDGGTDEHYTVHKITAWDQSESEMEIAPELTELSNGYFIFIPSGNDDTTFTHLNLALVEPDLDEAFHELLCQLAAAFMYLTQRDLARYQEFYEKVTGRVAELNGKPHTDKKD